MNNMNAFLFFIATLGNFERSCIMMWLICIANVSLLPCLKTVNTMLQYCLINSWTYFRYYNVLSVCLTV